MAFMNRGKRSLTSKTPAKLMVVIISVALVTSSLPPKEAEASLFSDFVGGLLHSTNSTDWVLCPDNPTFRKNNPFRRKAWELEESFDNFSQHQETEKLKLPPHVFRTSEPETREKTIAETEDISITTTTPQHTQVSTTWIADTDSEIKDNPLVLIILRDNVSR